MEVRQRIEPRSTNHPSGLIPVLGIGSVRDHEQNTGQIITNLHMDVRERARRAEARAGYQLSVTGEGNAECNSSLRTDNH